MAWVIIMGKNQYLIWGFFHMKNPSIWIYLGNIMLPSDLELAWEKFRNWMKAYGIAVLACELGATFQL
jgi:hypothetical protein